MKISNPCKLVSSVMLFALSMMLLAMLAPAPGANADSIDPDADVPDLGASDPTPANPVLEIPQQCDQDSVAMLCDRSSTDATSSATADATGDPSSAGNANDSVDVSSNSDVGTVYDYANQNITGEGSAMGTTLVPFGAYTPGYRVLAPAPMIVSAGPGSYQQWAGGPGAWHSMTPGPGYIAPMPLGYRPSGLGGSFGSPMMLGGFRGGAFRR